MNTQNVQGNGDFYSLQDNGAEIHSQEIVLHDEPSRSLQKGTRGTAQSAMAALKDRSRGGTANSTPARGHVHEYQEQPLIALDWLSQIKAHVRVQKA